MVLEDDKPFKEKDLADLKSKWEKGPLNPGALDASSRGWPDFVPRSYKVQHKDSLEEIAEYIAKVEFPGFTWEDLTKYNWGVHERREVNWCLRFFTECSVPTSDNFNWTFRYRVSPEEINPKLLSKFVWKTIWVPSTSLHLQIPPMQYRGCRTRTVTLDTRRCIHLQSDGTCGAIRSQPPCRPPHADRRKGMKVDLGEGPGFFHRLSNFFFGEEPEVSSHEKQEMKIAHLAFTRFQVEWYFGMTKKYGAKSGIPPDLKNAEKRSRDFEWEVVNLYIDYDRARTGTSTPPVDIKKLKESTIVSPTDIAKKIPVPPLADRYKLNSAKALHDLVVLSQAGVIKNAILRGCASWDEGNGRQQTYDLSKNRALFVKKLLGDPKVFGNIDPEFTPCSDHYCSRVSRPPTDSRVAVELEFQDPPREIDEQPPTQAVSYTFVKKKDLKTHQVSTKLLYGPQEGAQYISVNNAREMESLRKGALAMLEIFRNCIANAIGFSPQTKLEIFDDAKNWITNDWKPPAGSIPELSSFFFEELGDSPVASSFPIHDNIVETLSDPVEVNHSRCGMTVGTIEAALDKYSKMKIVRWAESSREFPVDDYDFIFDKGAP